MGNYHSESPWALEIHDSGLWIIYGICFCHEYRLAKGAYCYIPCQHGIPAEPGIFTIFTIRYHFRYITHETPRSAFSLLEILTSFPCFLRGLDRASGESDIRLFWHDRWYWESCPPPHNLAMRYARTISRLHHWLRPQEWPVNYSVLYNWSSAYAA